MIKKGLGKGLEALFEGAGEAMGQGNEPAMLEISKIIVRPQQPRKKFEDGSLEELANSIREHGILQPLLVRKIENGKYELVAGERRLRAAVMAGIKEVPVYIKELSDQGAREAALIENLQREDLNPVEEALAFKEMIEEYNYKQEELAKRIGKSRSYVANTLRLLNLPKTVLDAVEDGRLTAGHARAILAIKDPEQQIKLAQKIMNSSLSVREAEGAGRGRTGKTDGEEDIDIKELEERLQDKLGTRVLISRKRRGGSIRIDFYNDEDLNRLLEILGIEQ